MRKNNQLLVLTHLSQLLDIITGFGGFIVPLILWLTNKEKIYSMDIHGKSIINFQLSMLLYAIIAVPLILAFGLGILLLIGIGLLCFILPIVNAIKARNGEEPNYPFSINFVK
jgi:uncharacterized Tic20 family protein